MLTNPPLRLTIPPAGGVLAMDESSAPEPLEDAMRQELRRRVMERFRAGERRRPGVLPEIEWNRNLLSEIHRSLPRVLAREEEELRSLWTVSSEEELFLLMAIQTNGQDDDRRLVYADFLEERGDPR